MVELFITAGERLPTPLCLPPCFTTCKIHFPIASAVSLPVQGCFRFLQFTISYAPILPAILPRPWTSTPRSLYLQPNRSISTNGGNITAANSSLNSETMLFSLFLQIGFNEKDTEALLRSNPALRYTPYESIYNRVSSLQALGVTGFGLSRLISKRPDVLTAEEVDSFICFLLRNDDDLNLQVKIETAQIGRLLYGTEARFLLGFEDKVRLLLHHGIPLEKLAHVLNNINLMKALCLKSVQEIERMFAFLNRFGGVDVILRRPATLNYDLDTQLIPRIGFLFELSGKDEVATATVLRKLPFLIAYSVDHLNDHVEFLKMFAGLSDHEIFKIVLVYPNLFSASRKRKLHPRIDFLKQCGLSSNDIFRFLTKAPLFISLSFEENLAHKLAFLVKIGYKHRTKELAMALGAVTRTSYKNLQVVIGIFLDYGLTSEDILEMSRKHPQVLQYTHESLEEKLNYLINDMGREVGELLSFPAFLGYKLDSRIKHRYEAKKKIIGEGMSLNKLLSVSTERFSKKSYKQIVKTIDSLTESND